MIIENASIQHTNIHHHPAVPSNELLKYTKGADVGIHIIQNTCLNHFYCLPNKVFEYAVAGKPVIVSNFPDIVNEFSEVGSAWFIDPSTNDLQLTVESITHELLAIKNAKAEINKHRWAWEEAEEVYQEVYNSIINEK
jgi:glycosyltransferase involved in cell wall biosynthesis